MTTRSGGTRLRLLIGASAAVLVAAACGGSRHDPRRPRATPPAAPRPTGVRLGRAARAPPTGEIDLFNTDYAPDRRRRRRPGHRRRLAGGDPVQPVLPDPGHRGERRVGRRGPRLATFTHDYKYAPDLAAEIPTLDNGGVKVPGDNGDAMTVTWKLRDGLKWSDGTGPHLRRLQVRLGMGHGPRQRRRHHLGLRGRDGVGLPVRDGHGPPLQERVRGLHHDGGGPAAARTTCRTIPIADQVKGRGFRPDEVAQHARRAARSSSSRSRRAPSCASPATRTTRSWKTGKPAHLDSLVFKWYGDPDAMIAGYPQRRGRHRDRPPGLRHARRSRTWATR